jgi:hypothetical protein
VPISDNRLDLSVKFKGNISKSRGNADRFRCAYLA